MSYALSKAGADPTIEVSGTIDDNIVSIGPFRITGADVPRGHPAVLDGTGAGPVVANEGMPSFAIDTLDHVTIENGSGSTTMGR